MTDAAPATARAKTSGRTILLLVVLLSAVISFQLNSSMLNPALPEMSREFAPNNISPVLSLFFLAGALGSVVLTRLSDFLGRKQILLAILVTLVIGTILCLTGNFTLVLIGRLLQGTSSVAFAIAYLILREVLSPAAFATCLGAIAAINGGVAGFDGLLGGALLTWFGTYKAIFVFNLVFGVISLLLVIAVVPKTAKPDAVEGRMDWAGAGALVVALLCVNQFLERGPVLGWLSPVPLLLLAGTIAALVIFVVIEKRVHTPLIAVHHLKSRTVWPVVASTILLLAAYFSVMNFTIVFLSQNDPAAGGFGFGLRPELSALLILSLPALAGVLTAPLAGYLASRVGWVLLLRIAVIAGIGLLIILTLVLSSLIAVVITMVVLGVAYNGMMLPMCNGLGVTHSPKEAPGALSGLTNASFGIGASISVSLVAPLVSVTTGAAGFRAAVLVSLGVAVLALIVAFILKPVPQDRAGAAPVVTAGH